MSSYTTVSVSTTVQDRTRMRGGGTQNEKKDGRKGQMVRAGFWVVVSELTSGCLRCRSPVKGEILGREVRRERTDPWEPKSLTDLPLKGVEG